MSDLRTYHNCKITPVEQVRDGVLRGGVHESDGRFVTAAQHVRWGERISHDGSDLSASDLFADAPSPEGIYGGVIFNHFGHFLTESLGRLHAANRPLLRHLPIYVHTLWGNVDFDDTRGYHATTFRALGIDCRRIVKISNNIVIQKLVIPQIKFWFKEFGHLDDDFMQFLRTSKNYIEELRSNRSDLPKKIYVSRTRWDPARGIVVGEPEFEKYVQNQGYTILYPELLDLETQLMYYASADYIIFAEGSATHACILLPGLKARVAIIKRRAESQNFPNLRNQIGFIGKVMFCSNVYRYESMGMPSWSGIAYVNYESVSHTLSDFGFVTSKFDTWTSSLKTAEHNAISRFCRAAADYEEFTSALAKCQWH